MTAEPVQLSLFLSALFLITDVVEVRRLPSACSTWHVAGDVRGIAAACARSNVLKENIYVSINPRRGQGHRGNKGVALSRCLFADFDGKHLTSTTPAEQVAEVRVRIAAACLPDPTMIVFSGHGVHVYWRLDEPITDLDVWDELMDALITALGSDVGAKGGDRIMRVPGYVNWKPPAAEAFVVECVPSRRYGYKDLACAIIRPAELEPAVIEEVEKTIAAKVQHTYTGDRASVIAAFNTAVPIVDILSAAGYDVVGSRHFRRPGKTDRGFSGIIRPNNAGVLCSVHWSSNDPLNDQKFKTACGIHDPFDVFCILNHKGDVSAAVKAAAGLLGLELPKHKADIAILEEILAGDDATTFKDLYTTSPQTPDSRLGMKRIMAKYTTNPLQVGRILALSAAAVGVTA